MSLSAKELTALINEALEEDIKVSVDKKHNSTKKVMDRIDRYTQNYFSLVNNKDKYLELLEAFVEYANKKAKVRESDIKWAINRFWLNRRKKK